MEANNTNPRWRISRHTMPAGLKVLVPERIVLPAHVLLDELLKVTLDSELLTESIHRGVALELGFGKQFANLLEIALIADEQGEEHRFSKHGSRCR